MWLFTPIGLFFAGISTAFNTKVRWGLLGVSGLILLASTAHMLTLQWA